MRQIYIATVALALASNAHAQDWSKVPAIGGLNIVGLNPNGTGIGVPVRTVGNDQSVLTECGSGGQPTVPCADGALSGIRGVSITNFATSSALESSVGRLNGLVGLLRAEERSGIAATAAMASASMPSAAGRTSWVVNSATFSGSVGFGGSIAHRFTDRYPIAVTAGMSFAGTRGSVYRLGLAGEF